MHIKQLDATIYFARALFKPTAELPLELQFLQHLPTMVANLISVYWFGRIQSMGIGGWNLGRVCWLGTGRRFYSLTFEATQR